MKRKKYFKNIGIITKFGFMGTLFCFLITSSLTYLALKLNYLTKNEQAINLNGLHFSLTMQLDFINFVAI